MQHANGRLQQLRQIHLQSAQNQRSPQRPQGIKYNFSKLFMTLWPRRMATRREVPERRNLNSSLDDRERLTAHVHSRRHVKATDKLSEVQERTGVQQKKLIIDVDTRWNSTYCMMERFLEQHKVTTTTLCLLGKSNMCLNGDELEVGSDTLRTN
ncbi:hypothetical protein Pcinc_025867 [Petrolisthes cinctipes]|uniref:Uncharacterized protein n=1 Tax=Petrolisthes cinctipes TaxID=88211 RepID=A0AAE1F786_PETCI|nr:hypothetical protein Pcinc_025867 [Petrolisthes cinctipes]